MRGWAEWMTGPKPITHYSVIKENNYYFLYEGGRHHKSTQTPSHSTKTKEK